MWYLCGLFVFWDRTHYIVQAGLKLTMEYKLASDLQSSWLSLLGNGIPGMCHHVWQHVVFFFCVCVSCFCFLNSGLLKSCPKTTSLLFIGHSTKREPVVLCWAFKMQPDMSLDNIKMASSDLLERKDLDSGGFGKVSLCFHRSHGFVILKKVYTGPNRAEWVGNRHG